MTTTIDDNSLVTTPTTVTNSDSPYTTSGDQYIYADTSTGAITVTLSTADTESGREIRILDTGGSASSNNITVDTEGGEIINPGSKSSITLSTDGTYVDLFSDGSNWFSDRADDKQTVTTEQGDITNETFVRANRGSDSPSTTSGSWINAFDGEDKDVRGEFNSSAQFSPDESGEYVILANIDIRGSTVANDELGMRIRNITDGSNVRQSRINAASSSPTPQTVFIEDLNSAKTYEIQCVNFDSSFVIESLDNTKGVIKRSVVA